MGVRGAGGDVLREHADGADHGRRRGSAPVLGVQLHRDRGSVRPGLVVRAALRCLRRRARWLRRRRSRSAGPASGSASRASCSSSWHSGRGVGSQRLLTASRVARTSATTHGRCRTRAGRWPTWMAAHAPVDTPVMADRYVSQQVGSLGRMLRVAAQRHVPDLGPLHERRTGAPRGAEADLGLQDPLLRRRLADGDHAPAMGYWFTRDEPGAGGTDLFPQAAIDRFNCLPWLRAVYAAGPVDRLRGRRRRLASHAGRQVRGAGAYDDRRGTRRPTAARP